MDPNCFFVFFSLEKCISLQIKAKSQFEIIVKTLFFIVSFNEVE